VPFSALQNNELKFQFSFKGRLIKWGNENSIWLAYSQQSFWQFFDTQNSRPFRESNYEPEVIWSHQYSHSDRGGIYQNLRMINAAIVHQSNGQSNPRSRSWNRVYLQAGFEKECENGDQIIVQPKIWARMFQEKDPTQNDNPDITHYLGYGEVQFRYLNYDAGELDYQFSALAKTRSLQFDLDKHVSGDFRLHLQYFTGYGESLIEYNHKNTTWGVGLSLPY
jgi:phospholipase A1